MKGRIVNYHKIRRFVGENVVFRLDADVDFVVASASVLADVAAMNLRKAQRQNDVLVTSIASLIQDV